MVWFALAAMAASSVIGGMQQSKAETKQRKYNNQAAIQQNKLNWLETERALLSLDAQRASLRDQTAKNLSLAVRMANQQRGAVQADIAAAGMKGATADQVLMDVQTDMRERQFEIGEQHIKGMYDIDMHGLRAISGARAGYAQLDYQKAPGMGQHLTNAALQMTQQYAQSYYQFGASSKGAPTR